MPTLAELIVKVGANIGGLERGFGAAQGQIDALVKKTRPMADDFTAVGKVVTGAGIAIGAGLGHAVSVASDFEQQMSKVQALSGGTRTDFERLRDAAIELGAKTSFSASEAAQGMQNFAAAGLNTTEILAAMPGMLDAAAAGGMSLADTSDLMVSALKAFGLEAGESGRVANVLASAANASAISMQDISYSLKYAAPVAHAAGMSIEEVSAALAIMGNAGIKGETAGTTMRAALASIVHPGLSAAAVIDKYGLSFTDAAGNMLPMKGIIDEVKTKFAGLTQEQRLNAVAGLFGREAMAGMLTLMDAGSGQIEALTQQFIANKTAAQDMAKVMLDNFAGSMEQLRGSVESAEISIGQALIPTIRGLTDTVTGAVNWFNSLSPSMKETVAGAAALTSGVGILGGGMLLMVGQIPNIVQGFGSIRTMWTATSAAASAGGEALKTALLSPVSSCSALTLAVGGAAAAFAGWKLGEWIRENSGLQGLLDRWTGQIRVLGEEVVSANEKILAAQGAQAKSTHGLATVTKLLMLAEQEGVGSKEALLARYAPLIQAMERGGTAGEAAFDQAVRMYQADRNAAEAIQKKTVGIDAQRIAFADYLAAQTKGTTATQENTAATAANTAAATSNAAATAALAGQYSQALPAATARASAAVQEAAAIQTQATSQGQMEVAKLSDMWRIGPTGALVQVKSGLEDFGATHGQVIQQAISQLAEYQAQAKVTLTIVENARSQASQSIKDMAGQHHFSGMSGVQSGGYDMGNLFGSAAARNLTSVATGADRERYAIQSLIQSAMGSGISMSETLIQTAKRAVQKYGTSYTSWSSDQIEALKASGGTIPGLARGGVVRRAGTALVGEQGPELLSMPRGASVAPLPAAGMGGQTFITNNYYIDVEGSLISESELFDKVRRGARRHRNANLAADMS